MTMIVEKIKRPSRLEKLKPDWNDLLSKSSAHPVFTSFEWYKAWWDSYGSDTNTPFVLVVRENNRIAGIAGFYKSFKKKRLVKRTILNVMGQPQADYFDLLAIPEKKLDVASVIFDHLIENEKWDTLVLENVPETSEILPFLVNIAKVRKMNPVIVQGEVCPYFYVHGSFKAYLKKRFSKNRSKNYRQSKKKLEKVGNLAFDVLTSQNPIREALPRVADLEAKSWKGEHRVGLFWSEQDRTFITKVCLSLVEQKKTALSLLFLGDQLIAYDMGFITGNCLHCYNGAYDPLYRKYSPGIISIKKVIKWCFENNMDTVDLSRGGDAYKAIWTDTAKKTVNIHFFKPTRKGYLLAKEKALKQYVDHLRKRNHTENGSIDFKIE